MASLARFIVHALHVGEENQLIGVESLRTSHCHLIAINVKDGAIPVSRDASHYRYIRFLDENVQQTAVGGHWPADLPEVGIQLDRIHQPRAQTAQSHWPRSRGSESR